MLLCSGVCVWYSVLPDVVRAVCGGVDLARVAPTLRELVRQKAGSAALVALESSGHCQFVAKGQALPSDGLYVALPPAHDAVRCDELSVLSRVLAPAAPRIAPTDLLLWVCTAFPFDVCAAAGATLVTCCVCMCRW